MKIAGKDEEPFILTMHQRFFMTADSKVMWLIERSPPIRLLWEVPYGLGRILKGIPSPASCVVSLTGTLLKVIAEPEGELCLLMKHPFM